MPLAAILRGGRTSGPGDGMGSEASLAKTAATLDEIRLRVAHALDRHPRCRGVRFEVVRMPRSRKGGNWTVSLQAIGPEAVWEASDIIAEIQEAYELAVLA